LRAGVRSAGSIGQHPRIPQLLRDGVSEVTEVLTLRLRATHAPIARRLFTLMAEIFGEANEPLSDEYLERLLHRGDVWAMAAFCGDELVGGLTAYTIPMTRTPSAEILLYDIAVRPERQRQGIGRQLILALRSAADAAGIEDVFVPVDNDDSHALDFYRALRGEPVAVTHFTFRRHTNR
jgi:aminoglycoside 3-N-acetyltransferase I